MEKLRYPKRISYEKLGFPEKKPGSPKERLVLHRKSKDLFSKKGTGLVYGHCLTGWLGWLARLLAWALPGLCRCWLGTARWHLALGGPAPGCARRNRLAHMEGGSQGPRWTSCTKGKRYIHLAWALSRALARVGPGPVPALARAQRPLLAPNKQKVLMGTNNILRRSFNLLRNSCDFCGKSEAFFRDSMNFLS